MPYIKKQNRDQYRSIVEKVLQLIPDDDQLEQAEYVGYFIVKVAQHLSPSDCQYFQNPFEIICTNEAIKKILSEQSQHLIDLPHLPGDVNYVLSMVIWGFLGDYPNFEQANYTTRSYMHGIILRIEDLLNEVPRHLESASSTMLLSVRAAHLRSYMMLRGVIGDVKMELYRRKTSIFEDKKIVENGDIYVL